MRFSSLLTGSVVLATGAFAGFPTKPTDTITKKIPGQPGAYISYKPTTICETKSQGYAGYVHIPASQLGAIESSDPYSVSMFFWYFEARKNPHTAQTAIYLAGGPGESSMYGAAQSGGPCTVLPDSNSTQHNPWSWNENVNMLYVDQPVGTGFSYDALVRSTQNLLYLAPTGDDLTGLVPLEAYGGNVPRENATFRYGTFASQNLAKTANTTRTAARTMWHFSQSWFAHFPEYKTQDRRISLWGNSYGGYWVPATAEYMVRQNAKIKSGQVQGTVLDVAQVGWTNGCTDALYQIQWYPDQAYNNTYGLRVIPQHVYEESKRNFTKPGGCRDQIERCRAMGTKLDPDYLGSSSAVNDVCAGAIRYCEANVVGAFDALSNRSDFDMAHLKPEPFPTSYLDGFFNRAWVQRDLGVPLNFTAASNLVTVLFFETGDLARYAGKYSVEYLLDHGVRVHMVYGDRDYRCPWNGAEQLSLGFAWAGERGFHAAGYQDIVDAGGSSYGARRSGVVRQHGLLSFSRVFQAGHDVASYAPEAAFEIFDRAMAGRDIATGTLSTAGNAGYSTKGPQSSFAIKNKLPPPPPFNCNIYNVFASCTVEQYAALMNGSAVIRDTTVVRPAGGSPGALGNVFG